MCNSYVWTRKCLFKRFGNPLLLLLLLLLFFLLVSRWYQTVFNGFCIAIHSSDRDGTNHLTLCVQWESIDVKMRDCKPDRNGVNQMSCQVLPDAPDENKIHMLPPIFIVLNAMEFYGFIKPISIFSVFTEFSSRNLSNSTKSISK